MSKKSNDFSIPFHNARDPDNFTFHIVKSAKLIPMWPHYLQKSTFFTSQPKNSFKNSNFHEARNNPLEQNFYLTADPTYLVYTGFTL